MTFDRIIKTGIALAGGLFLFLVFTKGTGHFNNTVRKTTSIQPHNVSESDYNVTVIYGDDDRQDYNQVSDSGRKKLAESTVALFKADQVKVKDGKANLSTSNFGESYNLCPDEPFRDQPSGAFCSGSLVGPNTVMTAGHCVTNDAACTNTKFVFGFTITSPGANPTSVASNEVYGCARLVARKQENAGADFAIIELDRAVANHTPLKVNRTGNVSNKAPVFVIGHPAGLPTKVADGANVRDASPSGFFVANLDTYGGNSGSAVFNAVTGEIEGILVRGETDFVYDNERQCRKSNRVSNDAGRGEDVTKVSEVTQYIPKTVKGGNLLKSLGEIKSPF